MKKYIVGMLIGFFLAFSVSAHASDISSLIGKAIEGEFPVSIDGNVLEKKALVVDGTAYVPLRVFGKAIGYDSSFNADLGITFKKSEATNKMSTTSTQTTNTIAKQEQDSMDAIANQANIKNESISKLQGQINIKKGMFNSDQANIDDLTKKLGVHTEIQKDMTQLALDADKVQVDNINADIQTNKDDMAKLQTDINDLQSQLDTLNASTP